MLDVLKPKVGVLIGEEWIVATMPPPVMQNEIGVFEQNPYWLRNGLND